MQRFNFPVEKFLDKHAALGSIDNFFLWRISLIWNLLKTNKQSEKQRGSDPEKA